MSNTTSGDVILGKDLKPFNRSMAFLGIAIIYFFYCFNFLIGGFVRPALTKAVEEGGMGFSIAEVSIIFAGLSFGTILGTILFGWLFTKIGKKITLILLALLITATSLIPLLAPDDYTLWRVARILAGISLGGMFGTAQPLMAELFPQKYRGILAAFLTSTFSMAIIFGGWIYSLVGDNWQMILYIAAVPPIIGSLLVTFFVPSDYTITKQRQKESLEKAGESISYISMYKGKYFWIGLGAIFLSGINFVAGTTFSYNATTYYTKILHLTPAIAGNILSVYGTGSLIGYYTWGGLSDRLGRRFPLFGMLLCSVTLFGISLVSAESVQILFALSFIMGFAMGFSGGWGAYYTELFPQKFAGLGTGLSFNGGRILSMAGVPLIALLADTTYGMPGMFMVASVIFIFGAVLWFFMPETLVKKNKDNN